MAKPSEMSELAIVLAAGKGTRMKSERPKVVHEIAGRSMLGHVLATVRAAQPDGVQTEICVVVSPGAEAVVDEARRWDAGCKAAVQAEQKGTGDAALAARDVLAPHHGCVFVLFADTPLVRPETLHQLRAALVDGADVAVLAFEAVDPTGYGRVITEGADQVVAIVEHKDASEAQRALRLCNSGVMAFAVPDLLGLLSRIGNDNVQGEYYLTDVIALARGDGLVIRAVTCPEADVMGVNARHQLAIAEGIYQNRRRAAVMADGATLIAPETVWFSYDTVIGRDVLIEPNVFFGAGVSIADNVTIRANCHFEGARVASGAVIGPFARLRPGAELGPDTRIGNFVEVKNVTMGAGAKANHLAYLGDGTVGADANIGAGTIFCNYDGVNKHRTTIGERAFIGSNSCLVAPVEIGAGALVGSGSVITSNVPADALAIARGRQDVREDWARRFRERALKAKQKRAES